MSKKVLTGAMAAVMATGMVTPVMAETNETKSLAELHVAAFEAYNKAMDAARTGKANAVVQKLINEARTASATFLDAYEKETGSREHGDIPTWSTGLDSIQHPILAAIVDGEDGIVTMEAKPETITQARLNKVYSLLWNELEDDTDNLVEEYLIGEQHGLSAAYDRVQQIFNKKVVDAVEAAKNEKTEAAVAAAKALVTELKTALNPQLVEAAKVLEKELTTIETQIVVKVESVTAINASELVVKFNAQVDTTSAKLASNYQLKINNESAKIDNIQMGESSQEVIIRLNSTFQKGDRYVIQTNDAIKSANGKKFEKFVSEEKVFNESAAPTLLSVKPTTAGLLVEFDRPVKTTTVGLIKNNGVALEDAKLSAVSSEAGSYTYKVETKNTSIFEKGKHEITIYDVEDTAAAYPSKASVLTGAYTITDATATAPKVVGIEAVNANRFFVQTNVPVSTATAKIKVEKGNHEFAHGTLNDNAVVAYEAGTYDEKPGIWVIVTDGNAVNPLYKNSETSVDLTVTLENYTAAGLVGEKSVKTVTLNKNNSKPVVKDTSTDATNKELIVAFKNEIDGNITKDDVVVRDKSGVIKIAEGVTLSGNEISIKLSDVSAAPYTVEFKANKFKNLENTTSISGYLVNTVNNDAMKVEIKTSQNSNFKYKELALSVYDEVDNNEGNVKLVDNTINITFPATMTDSALKLANYKLDGKALPTGTTIDFVGDKKNVRITLPNESLTATTKYRLTLSTELQTSAGEYLVGSLQTKEAAYVDITLNDCVAPVLKSAKYLVGSIDEITSTTTTTEIEVTFNENLSPVMNTIGAIDDFKVLVNGSEIKVINVTDGDFGDAKVTITLGQAINVSQAANISIVPEGDNNTEINIIDKAGNKANTKVTVDVPTLK